jgi:phosphonate transport system substrate-binding protein
MMKTLFSRRFSDQLVRMLVVFLALVPLLACSGDSDYKKVDFREKIDVPPPDAGHPGRKTLRVAVAAMISPKETLIFYRELIDYLFSEIDHDIELIQRKTYGEVNRMLSEGRIDLAFICTGPFVSGNEQSGFKAVATPIIRGQPFYQSYLIVHRESALQSLADLQGKEFAFTDPESNTGALVPRYWLKEMGMSPENYFRSFTYTYSHDNAIMAVAKKLVDGAAVDGHLWEYYQRNNAFYTSRTRVIKKSEPFGSPPIVVSDALSTELKTILVDRIMSMHEDPEGRRILSELMIDRFTTPEKEWYLPVTRMLDRLRLDKELDHVSAKP